MAALDQIAVQLGITKPTLYYYVPGKADLVQACALRGWEQALSQVQRALQSSAMQPLSAALQAYAQALSSNFGWCMVRAEEYALPNALHKPLRQQRKAVEQCLAAHTQATDAALLMRALEGAVLQLPKAQWLPLVAVLVQGVQVAPTAEGLAVLAVGRDCAHSVLVEESAIAHTVEPEPEPELKNNMENQMDEAIKPTGWKAFNQSGSKREKASQAIEQISLF